MVPPQQQQQQQEEDTWTFVEARLRGLKIS